MLVHSRRCAEDAGKGKIMVLTPFTVSALMGKTHKLNFILTY